MINQILTLDEFYGIDKDIDIVKVLIIPKTMKEAFRYAKRK
jgi:hypothetical protein